MNFESYIANRKSNAIHELKGKFSIIRGESVKHGAYGGSRMFVEYQKAISKQLGEFGIQLLDFMNKNDPLHSPIKTKDFDTAKTAVDELMTLLFEEYKHRENLGKVHANSVQEINQQFIDLEKNKVIHEIDLSKQTFKSKRSFWKLAFGDAKRKLFSGLLSFIMVTLGGFMGPHFMKLFDTIKTLFL